MRAKIGLPPLESRIGLSAHDFFQAAMAQTAILSRTRKMDGSPTVPSRWLLRLSNLLGGVAPERLSEMRARGERWLKLVDALEEPRDGEALPAPSPRQSPAPPVEARPTRFSVTEVETLIRDPYAVYAKKVLRLRPLNELEEEPDARDRGELLHRICERFVLRSLEDPSAPLTPLFDAVSEQVLQDVAAWPTLHAFWRARARQMRDWFVAGEETRRAEGAPIALEAPGALTFPAALGEITLTATADRIDRLPERRLRDLRLQDRPPADRQADRPLRQADALEAAILAQAGFERAPKGPVERLAFLELTGGRKGGEERQLDGDAQALGDRSAGGVRQADGRLRQSGSALPLAHAAAVPAL